VALRDRTKKALTKRKTPSLSPAKALILILAKQGLAAFYPKSANLLFY